MNESKTSFDEAMRERMKRATLAIASHEDQSYYAGMDYLLTFILSGQDPDNEFGA